VHPEKPSIITTAKTIITADNRLISLPQFVYAFKRGYYCSDEVSNRRSCY
jgi:hypothetical protein